MRNRPVFVAFPFVLLMIFSEPRAEVSEIRRADGNEPLAVVPFDLYDKRVWLTVLVNNKVDLVCQFDSAAGTSVLTPAAAERASIRGDAFADAQGAGDGTIRIPVARNVPFALEGVSWSAPRVPLIALDRIDEATGRRSDGLVGKDFLEGFVVEVDYQTQKISVFDPASFNYTGSGVKLPITVTHGPVVQGKIVAPGRGVIPCRLLVDAPHSDTVTFTRPFVEKHDLLDAAAILSPKLIETTIEGVGGKSRLFIGRISSLALGPYSFNNVKAGFCLAEGGTLASSEIDGVLGAEVLRRFRVILDYSRKTMILEPAEGMADAFEHDMSGMELRTVPGDLKTVTVRRVLEETPAAEAGVLIGDILLAVDGRSTDELSLPELREMLRLPGTVRLTIRRGSEQKELVLALRRLI